MIFKTLLLKLASRCNLNCTYCYWFRDAEVYRKPPLLTDEAESAFLAEVTHHVSKYRLERLNIIFHGGEPLLFGLKRFGNLCSSLREIETLTNCQISLGLTTNGVLVTSAWAKAFREFDVAVALSIDGPAEIHDHFRVGFDGQGTLRQVLFGLETLRASSIEPSVLAVCDVESDPAAVLRFLVDRLCLRKIDVLVPDATHEDAPPSISRYYRQLFDLWYDKYSSSGVHIRFLENIVRGTLGFQSNSEAIGFGPVTTVTVLTDGGLEPLDVLRIAGDGSTKTGLNIKCNHIQELERDPVWLEAFQASTRLCDTCEQCSYRICCGGGYLPNRWSVSKRFDNPSVYCQDLKEIFQHTREKIVPDLYVQIRRSEAVPQ
jgi:uncharacterized protein